MADYSWFDKSPSADDLAASKYRPQGYEPVWDRGSYAKILYYKCRRGCGTLVWNPEEHSQNVCTKFNPVAGE